MTIEIAGIFTAGALTLLTPCVLPLVPVYLALLLGPTRSQRPGLTLVASTLAFSLGLVAVFVALGLTATALGSLLTEFRSQLVILGGLIIFLFGLKFVGALQLSLLEREKRLDDSRLQTRYRLVNALVMGAVFALGWTPCIGPILGSVLTYTASSTSDPIRGAGYLAAYGLGFTTPLLVLSLFADGARRFVGRMSPWLPRLEKLGGLLMMAVGLYMMLGVTGTPSASLSPSPVAAQGVTISPPLGQPSTRPRLVQFTSSECSVCRQMIPTVALIERDCDGRKVDVIKVDVTHGDNRKLASNYGIRGVPTFVFLDAGGSEVARLVGYQTLGALRQALSALVGESCDGLGGFVPDPQSCASGSGVQCSS